MCVGVCVSVCGVCVCVCVHTAPGPRTGYEVLSLPSSPLLEQSHLQENPCGLDQMGLADLERCLPVKTSCSV